jgi:hypothetical protein
LTIAAETKRVFEAEVVSRSDKLEEAKRNLKMAEHDLKCFITAAEAKGVDPAPYIQRRNVHLLKALVIRLPSQRVCLS